MQSAAKSAPKLLPNKGVLQELLSRTPFQKEVRALQEKIWTAIDSLFGITSRASSDTHTSDSAAETGAAACNIIAILATAIAVMVLGISLQYTTGTRKRPRGQREK